MADREKSHGTDAVRGARNVVVTGGTDGIGRAVVLGRAERGDRVLAVGSNQAKGRRLLAEARAAGLAHRVAFLAADLATIAGNGAVVAHVAAEFDALDALVLAANRHFPERVETVDGLESTFALYYLSRYLLGHRLGPLLAAGERRSVIVNIAAVGLTSGRIRWDDLQARARYRTITAQLQAARANDLLGVAMAARSGTQVSYVLYHPGFTRSGNSAMERVNPLTRALIKAAARVAARPVAKAAAPVHDFIDAPPAAPLTALDRRRPVPLDLPTLAPTAARRLATTTAELLGPTP